MSRPFQTPVNHQPNLGGAQRPGRDLSSSKGFPLCQRTCYFLANHQWQLEPAEHGKKKKVTYDDDGDPDELRKSRGKRWERTHTYMYSTSTHQRRSVLGFRRMLRAYAPSSVVRVA